MNKRALTQANKRELAIKHAINQEQIHEGSFRCALPLVIIIMIAIIIGSSGRSGSNFRSHVGSYRVSKKPRPYNKISQDPLILRGDRSHVWAFNILLRSFYVLLDPCCFPRNLQQGLRNCARGALPELSFADVGSGFPATQAARPSHGGPGPEPTGSQIPPLQ